MRFHETNKISWNFSGLTLGFCEVSNYFVNFWFCFRYFQKMTPKFQFHSYRLKILKFETWWRKFKESISQLPSKRPSNLCHFNSRSSAINFSFFKDSKKWSAILVASKLNKLCWKLALIFSKCSPLFTALTIWYRQFFDRTQSPPRWHFQSQV